MTGRPSDFTQETADTICERIADGESLRKICDSDEMPNKSTVFRWLGDESHVAFRDQYARAREAQADTLFDEVLEIADESKGDTITDDYGNPRANVEWINRSRLRVDARKWMAGKLRPKVYGDKLELAGDADRPLGVVIQRFTPEPTK